MNYGLANDISKIKIGSKINKNIISDGVTISLPCIVIERYKVTNVEYVDDNIFFILQSLDSEKKKEIMTRKYNGEKYAVEIEE